MVQRKCLRDSTPIRTHTNTHAYMHANACASTHTRAHTHTHTHTHTQRCMHTQQKPAAAAPCERLDRLNPASLAKPSSSRPWVQQRARAQLTSTSSRNSMSVSNREGVKFGSLRIMPGALSRASHRVTKNSAACTCHSTSWPGLCTGRRPGNSAACAYVTALHGRHLANALFPTLAQFATKACHVCHAYQVCIKHVRQVGVFAQGPLRPHFYCKSTAKLRQTPCEGHVLHKAPPLQVRVLLVLHKAAQTCTCTCTPPR